MDYPSDSVPAPELPPDDQQRAVEIKYESVPAKPASASSASQGVSDKPNGAVGGAFWFLATVLLVLTAWWIGPLAVEKYRYAATRGRVQAEYEHAVQRLRNTPLNDLSLAYQLVAQRIRPSVVSVRAGILRSGLTEFLSGGQGSGVVLSTDGYIITNDHVVKNAQYVEVILHDRSKYEAEVVGTDPYTDLAVLKVDAPGLIAADWGDSDKLRVGSMVWAVGSPYGLDQTVTLGILSAKDRGGRESNYQEFLQTDAAVNPGNSGGPLVNAQGQVVGINTSIYGEKFQGISFAVPSSVCRHVYEQITIHGKVSRGFLGVLPDMVTQEDKIKYSLPDLDGAIIRRISRNTPAAGSDLRRNDVIRKWNGNPIRSYTNLYRYIGMTPPFTTATAEILREGKPMVIEVPVGEQTATIE